MSLAAATSELHASRRWVLTMALLALFFVALWCLLCSAIWIDPRALAKVEDPSWLRPFMFGFFVQLTVFSFAAIAPFVLLLRYALALFALKDGDRPGLERVVDLNVHFWRQCAYLMWGVVWLFAFVVIGGILLSLLGPK